MDPVRRSFEFYCQNSLLLSETYSVDGTKRLSYVSLNVSQYDLSSIIIKQMAERFLRSVNYA
jgi:hypothetical protein